MSLFIHFNTRGISFCHQWVGNVKWKLVGTYCVPKTVAGVIQQCTTNVPYHISCHFFCILLLHLSVMFIVI